MTNFTNGDPEALDQLTDNILSRGGDIVIADLLNEYRYGSTTKWDVVREILRMAAEEMTETRATVG
jgi:hypothetical protein